MYRARLRSPAGCMRCKKRHAKCDEKRPRCSFCVRYNLICTWPIPSRPRHDGRRRPKTIEPPQAPSSPGRELARREHAPSLDPFHTMPMHYSKDRSMISDSLHSFFVGITQSTLPFDVATTHQDLTRGWLASVFLDEAVCTSFVAYCAWFYSERTISPQKLTRLGLQNTARSLTLLRHRVEGNETVTDGTLLAAALHFFIATLSTKSVSQLSRVAQGIAALVAARGGPRVTMDSVSPSTRQSLIFADVFNSLLGAQTPFLSDIKIPERPSSYESFHVGSEVDEDITNCLGQEITNVLENIRFVLFFRTPSQQTRKLSSDESRYLFMLLQKISYGLCNQQSNLAKTQSIRTIATYGLIIVKEEVLLDIVQHPILPITILRRLRSVISTYNAPQQGLDSTMALWASVMALVGTEFESERTWAVDYITKTLDDRYGPQWPPDWSDDIRQEIQRVLWHVRIESAFKVLCARLNNTCDRAETHATH